MALSTQYASEFASFRHGMTTDTSTAGDTPRLTGCVPSEVSTVPIGGNIISRSFKHFTRASSLNSCFRGAGDSGPRQMVTENKRFTRLFSEEYHPSTRRPSQGKSQDTANA